MMTDWLPDFPIMWLNFKLFCGPDLCIFRFLLKCFHLFNITSSEFIFDGINIWNISLSCPILVLPLSLYQKGRKRLRDKFTQLNSLDQSVCTINLISLWVFKLSITYIFLIFPLQRSSGWYLLQTTVEAAGIFCPWTFWHLWGTAWPVHWELVYNCCVSMGSQVFA